MYTKQTLEKKNDWLQWAEGSTLKQGHSRAAVQEMDSRRELCFLENE